MNERAIELNYKVLIGKARRGYFYIKKMKGDTYLSKDYPTLKALEEVLEMKRKANLIFKVGIK